MTVKAEAQQLSSSPESTFGTAATTGWRQRRYLPGGIKGFSPTLKVVEDNSVSANAQDEKGDVVDHDSKVAITMLACKDSLDDFGQGIARSAEKFAFGAKRWYPTAVTATGYTVDSLGTQVPLNALVYARGFVNAANNGLQVAVTGSTATEVKFAGSVIETVTPLNTAQLETAGVQGAAGDITMDGSGNLLATALNFTTLGLVAGEMIYLPNSLGAGFCFANTAYKGFARVKIIAAGKLTLEARSWTVGAADAGAAKTIRILFGSALRMISINDADYLETSSSFEWTQPGSGVAGAVQYVYNYGNTVDKFELDASLAAQLKMVLSFVGTKCDDPVTARLAGPSTAIPPIAFAPYNTVGDERRIALMDASENVLVTKINNWKLHYQHNVSPLKVQGTEGAVEAIYGRTQAMVDMTVYLGPGGAQAAIHAYTTNQFVAAFGNAQGGFCIDCPEVSLTGGDPQTPANGPVTLPLQLKVNRSSFYGFSMILTRFPFLPALV